MSTMYSIRMPATKRQRTSILTENKILYPTQLSHIHKNRSNNYYKSSTSSPSHELPKCSLVGVMKYLDTQSLNTLTKTSATMFKAANKYKKYQQKVNKNHSNDDIVMDELDLDLDINTNTNTNVSVSSLSLSLSVPCGNVPSLSLNAPSHENNNNNNNNNIFDTDIHNHLIINSHLNLHLKCDNNNNNNNINDDEDIDIFKQDRCSLFEILNTIQQIKI